MAHCLICGEPMGLKHLMGKRKTCSDKCRKAKQRKELKKMKTIKIDWLVNCPACDHSIAMVETSGSETHLNDGDKVECESCGMNGFIESVDCENVEAVWNDELKEGK